MLRAACEKHRWCCWRLHAGASSGVTWGGGERDGGVRADPSWSLERWARPGVPKPAAARMQSSRDSMAWPLTGEWARRCGHFFQLFLLNYR